MDSPRVVLSAQFVLKFSFIITESGEVPWRLGANQFYYIKKCTLIVINCNTL